MCGESGCVDENSVGAQSAIHRRFRSKVQILAGWWRSVPVVTNTVMILVVAGVLAIRKVALIGRTAAATAITTSIGVRLRGIGVDKVDPHGVAGFRSPRVDHESSLPKHLLLRPVRVADSRVPGALNLIAPGPAPLPAESNFPRSLRHLALDLPAETDGERLTPGFRPSVRVRATRVLFESQGKNDRTDVISWSPV